MFAYSSILRRIFYAVRAGMFVMASDGVWTLLHVLYKNWFHGLKHGMYISNALQFQNSN